MNMIRFMPIMMGMISLSSFSMDSSYTKRLSKCQDLTQMMKIYRNAHSELDKRVEIKVKELRRAQDELNEELGDLSLLDKKLSTLIENGEKALSYKPDPVEVEKIFIEREMRDLVERVIIPKAFEEIAFNEFIQEFDFVETPKSPEQLQGESYWSWLQFWKKRQ